MEETVRIAAILSTETLTQTAEDIVIGTVRITIPLNVRAVKVIRDFKQCQSYPTALIPSDMIIGEGR